LPLAQADADLQADGRLVAAHQLPGGLLIASPDPAQELGKGFVGSHGRLRPTEGTITLILAGGPHPAPRETRPRLMRLRSRLTRAPTAGGSASPPYGPHCAGPAPEHKKRQGRPVPRRPRPG